MKSISGSCLCGHVEFECENTFTEFHLCHCMQCQKTSGSAHVSNLFTHKNNIKWLKGIELIKRYDVPKRGLTNAFCTHCGSPVPYISSSGSALIVPAGVLDGEPSMKPQDNIFWSERASWYEEGLKSIRCVRFDEG